MHRIFFVRSSKEWTIQNSFGLLFYTAIPRIPSNRLELLENSLCAWQLWHALSIYRKFLCFSCGATKQLLLLIFCVSYSRVGFHIFTCHDILFLCFYPANQRDPIPVLLSCKPKRSAHGTWCGFPNHHLPEKGNAMQPSIPTLFVGHCPALDKMLEFWKTWNTAPRDAQLKIVK